MSAELDACKAWADAYEEMWDMADGFHGGLNYGEVIALADVLAAAGRGDLAATLIRGWGIGDPEMVDEHEAYEPGGLAATIASYGVPLGEYAEPLPWLIKLEDRA